MTRARLPVGLYDEPERYDLTIRALDRDGKPYDPAAGANDPNGDVTIPILLLLVLMLLLISPLHFLFLCVSVVISPWERQSS